MLDSELIRPLIQPKRYFLSSQLVQQRRRQPSDFGATVERRRTALVQRAGGGMAAVRAQGAYRPQTDDSEDEVQGTPTLLLPPGRMSRSTSKASFRLRQRNHSPEVDDMTGRDRMWQVLPVLT